MKPNATCSVCGHANYKKCPCPWKKAFQHWPDDLHKVIRARIGRLPSPGS